MNKITIKKEIKVVNVSCLEYGQIFEFNTNYYMKMEPLGDDYVRDAGNCRWCCELGTGRMCLMERETSVKPIYGTIEIMV